MNKYNYNKYPIKSTETACLVETLLDAQTFRFSGLVFPNVLDPYDAAADSIARVKNAIKGANGEPLINVVDVDDYGLYPSDENAGTLTRFEALKKEVNRNTPRLVRTINGHFIARLEEIELALPQDIIDSSTEYRNLAEKGNSNPKGLSDADEERFNELDRKLSAYYSKCI